MIIKPINAIIIPIILVKDTYFLNKNIEINNTIITEKLIIKVILAIFEVLLIAFKIKYLVDIKNIDIKNNNNTFLL